MTEQEKQALANDLTAYIGQPLNNPMTRSRWMEVARIALAALTSPPVKLPDRYDIGSMIDVEKDDDGPLYLREDVIGAIRAAGYQVEGE